MANVAQSHIDMLKSLENLSIAKGTSGTGAQFFQIFSNGEQRSNSTSEAQAQNTLARVLGYDFVAQLNAGDFDNLRNDDGFLELTSTDNGGFDLQGILDAEQASLEEDALIDSILAGDTEINPAESLGGLLVGNINTGDEPNITGDPLLTSSTDSSPSFINAANEAADILVNGVTGGGGSGSSTGGSTAQVSVASGAGQGTGGTFGTTVHIGTNPVEHLRSQLGPALDSLVDNNITETGDLGELLGSLFSNSFNTGAGLGRQESSQRFNQLRKAGKGTMGTRVSSPFSAQAQLKRKELQGI